MFRFISLVSVMFCFLTVEIVEAKVPSKIKEMVLSTFPPAVPSRALESAHEQLDPTSLRGFVVIKKGGIPAQRARFFISWQEYDYRGVVIHFDSDQKMTTRRGGSYTYLQKGAVLAVADYKFFHDTVYLKLITPDVYVPENKRSEKRHSRITVMLGFKFSKDVFRQDNADVVIHGMEEWLQPFVDLQEARAYAGGLKEQDRVQAAMEDVGKATGEIETVSEDISKNDKSSSDDKKRIEDLERKIESASRKMREAEKEMAEIKEEMKKGDK